MLADTCEVHEELMVVDTAQGWAPQVAVHSYSSFFSACLLSCFSVAAAHTPSGTRLLCCPDLRQMVETNFDHL